MTSSDDEALARRWYERESAFMEASLGKAHDVVMHAVIPFAVGGGLDLYYYPNGLPGTAMATKELCELPNQGSSNDVYSCYELVMFTRHPLAIDSALDESTGFGRAHANINALLTRSRSTVRRPRLIRMKRASSLRTWIASVASA